MRWLSGCRQFNWGWAYCRNWFPLNPQISGCGSFTGSPTVMMPLGGSVLNWIWEKPLGVVFNGICSGGLVEPFRGWSILRLPSQLAKSLRERTDRVITVKKHDPQCLWGHLTTCTSRHWSTDTTQDTWPTVPLCDEGEAGKAQSQGRHAGSPSSEECKGSVPDIVMHPHLTTWDVVAFIPPESQGCEFETKDRLWFLVQKWSGEGTKQ